MPLLGQRFEGASSPCVQAVSCQTTTTIVITRVYLANQGYWFVCFDALLQVEEMLLIGRGDGSTVPLLVFFSVSRDAGVAFLVDRIGQSKLFSFSLHGNHACDYQIGHSTISHSFLGPTRGLWFEFILPD